MWNYNRWKDALTLACACGHLEIVKLLMTHFHAQEDDDRRPHGNPGDIPVGLLPWVSWVKTTDGHVQNQEEHEKQLLTIACFLGRTNVAQWFMVRGIVSNTAFCEACREGHIDIVRLLIDTIDPEFVLTYPLSDAAKRGHTDIVQLFIDTAAHCEMISLNRDAMQNACSFGHVNVVRLLLTVIDMDTEQVRNVFQIACVNGHIEVARLLFSLIDKVDTYNGNFIRLFFEQVLNVVCIRGHLEIVRLLLPFVKNLAGGYKNACSRGQTHVVSFLLEHGVYSSDDHDSALYLACVGLHGGVLRVLFEYAVAHPHIGIDPSSNLQTVFVRATLACRMDVVELLLLWRPYARAWFVSSAHLNTALITAFQLGTGYSTIIRLLLDLPLEFGVNPALDANHLLAVAIRMRNTEYVRMLLDLPQERGVVALS
jgi:ankyrin repeat protein